MTEHQWIYVKVYADGSTDLTWMNRWLVRIGELLEDMPGVGGWFFLRFLDASGFHIRLRARVAMSSSSAEGDVRRACLDAFCSGDDAPTARIVADSYVPETAKFGVTTVADAELLFGGSSEIAVDLIGLEEGGGPPRKRVIPRLMEETRVAFAGNEPSVFWRRYADHWLARLSVGCTGRSAAPIQLGARGR